MRDWPLRCGVCGKFIRRPYDQYTPFGAACDLEPPDPVFLCRKCARAEEREAVKTGRFPTHWLPAAWEARAAKKLGYVRAGPPGAAWAHWYAPNDIPDAYAAI